MRLGTVLVALLVLAGCGGSADSESVTSVAPESVSGAVEQPLEQVDVVAESFDRTAEGVLAAAVILARGDAEQAVSDGVVTAAEVDAALEAIEGGLLAEWAALASP